MALCFQGGTLVSIHSEIMNGGASIIMCVSKNHIEFRSWLGWELKRLEKNDEEQMNKLKH